MNICIHTYMYINLTYIYKPLEWRRAPTPTAPACVRPSRAIYPIQFGGLNKFNMP